MAPTKSARKSGRAQDRLCNRYRRLRARGIRKHKVTVAIARELSAFIWELQSKCALPLPDYGAAAATN